MMVIKTVFTDDNSQTPLQHTCEIYMVGRGGFHVENIHFISGSLAIAKV